MREFILVFGFIASIGITFVYKSTTQTEVLKNQNSNNIDLSKLKLTEDDQKIIESLFGEPFTKSPIFLAVSNFKTPLKQSINSSNAKDFIALANENIVTLFNNLNHASGNKNRVLKLNLLARHLEILKVALQVNPTLSTLVNWNIVRQSSGLKNESSELLAHDLLRNYDLKNNGNLYLLAISKTYHGKAKADFFVSLSEGLLKSEKNLFLNVLNESLENDDLNTISPIILNLREMRLSQVEVVQVSKSLCHFQNNNEKWIDIKKSLNQIKIDEKSLCF